MKRSLLVLLAAVTCVYNSIAQNNIIAGMTNSGGNLGYGTTYIYNPATGNDSLLFSFGGRGNAILMGTPYANVIQASNGKLYGMASEGGNWNEGAMFCYDPVAGTGNIVVSFGSYGFSPTGSLVQASNGLLYGVVSSTIFCFNTATGQDSVVSTIAGYGGNGALMQATNGLLYGLTTFGGTNNLGTLYSFDPVSGKDTVLFSFTDSTGGGPTGSLIQATNGLFYGCTSYKGRGNYGTMFSYDPVSGKDSVLIYFNDSNGYEPLGSLKQATNGLLYGMAGFGARYYGGTIFSYNTVTGKDSILYYFNENGIDGVVPSGSFIQGTDGLLYATTALGGTANEGTIFSFDPVTGKDSVLINLTGMQNGDEPDGDLLLATDGNFYGMTTKGGTVGAGTLFRYNKAAQKDSVILNFDVIQQWTQNSPTLASNGSLYGMTYGGGVNDMGTLFSYNPATGKDSVLINFDGVNGENPNGALTQGSDGLLYGMTDINIFSYNPNTGTDSVRYYFSYTDGTNPIGSLMQASDGLFYGENFITSANLYGSLFSFDPLTNVYTTLIRFNDTNGSGPEGTLVEGANGILYGTTYSGGAHSFGMLFSYNLGTHHFDTLVSLGITTGAGGVGNLIADTANHLIYWACLDGFNSGALMSYNTNTEQVDSLVAFADAGAEGPTGILIWDTTANLIYGTTYFGGSNNYGVLYCYNTVNHHDSILYSFHDSIPASGGRIMQGHANNMGVGINPCGLVRVNEKFVTASVHKMIVKQSISVYPNPVTNSTNVLFSNYDKHYLELDDVTGRTIRTAECTGQQYELSCEGLAPGLYFVASHDEGQSTIATAKIVVQ